MFVDRIDSFETGVWQVRTTENEVFVLYVPGPERVRVEWLGNSEALLSGRLETQAPFAARLAAWGHQDEGGGLRPGLVATTRAVLVLDSRGHPAPQWWLVTSPVGQIDSVR